MKTLEAIKASVVIPFWNGIPLLLEAISSVIAQSHRNVEIILVDDGSTDDLTKLFEVIDADKRIRYFKQENQGPSIARNFGLKQSSGKYVAFLDADDLYSSEKIEEQIAFMEANSLSFSHTNYERISFNGDALSEAQKESTITAANKIEWIYPQIIEMCPIATPTVMVTKEAIGALSFKDNLRIGEDICLWIELARLYPVGLLAKPLTKVRVSQSSHAYHPEKGAQGDLNIAQYLIKDPHHSEHKQEIAILINNIALTLAKRINADPEVIEKLLILTRKELESLPTVQPIPYKKEAINFADVEGYFVGQLKPLIPSPVWSFSTRIYRALRGLVR